MGKAAVVLAAVAAVGLGCSPGGGSDLSNCRTFAIQWNGQAPGFMPLVIDDATGEVTYTQPGVGGVSTYADVEDFIEEGKTFGLVTRTSWRANQLEDRQFSYDGQGRQTQHSRETLTAGPIGYETATWTEHDDLQRPVAGDHESSWSDGTPDRLDTCTGSTVTVTYDEDDRTVTTVVDYSTGTLDGGGSCIDTPFINIAGRVEIEYFDSQNNWLRVESWQGFLEPSGDAQSTLSVGTPTASDTVCFDD